MAIRQHDNTCANLNAVRAGSEKCQQRKRIGPRWSVVLRRRWLGEDVIRTKTPSKPSSSALRTRVSASVTGNRQMGRTIPNFIVLLLSPGMFTALMLLGCVKQIFQIEISSQEGRNWYIDCIFIT
jgi:hypothetical protein